MITRARGRSLWGPLLLTVWTSSGIAQASSARLVGSVRDSGGGPVALAQFSLQRVRGFSDSAGLFRLEGLSAGVVILHVRRMGFEPLDLTLELAVGRTDSLSIVLTMVPRELAEVTTEAEARPSQHLADFYRHRQNGLGYYYDRKDIVAAKVQRTSDLLRRLPGVRLVPDRSGRYQVRMGRTSGGRDCPPDFWIDGIRAAFLNVDDVPLMDVDALEIYKGASALPPEYNTRVGSPACGVIVIWTSLPS